MSNNNFTGITNFNGNVDMKTNDIVDGGNLTVNGEGNIGGVKVVVGAIQGLQITGANGSMSGPHTQILTATDNRPLFQQLALSHDSINDLYDSYFDGSNFISSSATGNYSITKSSGTFEIRYGGTTTAGNTITFNPALTVDNSGDIKISNDLKVDNELNVGGTHIATAGTGGLQVIGTDSTVAGTAITTFTEVDVYPLWSQLSYSHGDLWSLYDCYLDGVGFKSSNASGSFALVKTNTEFQMRYATPAAQGSAITLTSGLAMGTAGNITMSQDLTVSGEVKPSTTDVYDLGTASFAWQDIYSLNALTVTSDRKAKKEITDTDRGLNFINKLKPKRYKMKNGVRPHYGLISQDIEDIVAEEKSDFGGFVKSKVDIFEVKTEGKGIDKKEIKKKIGEKDVYALRYSEFISPMIKAIQELSEMNKLLMDRIEVLEGK